MFIVDSRTESLAFYKYFAIYIHVFVSPIVFSANNIVYNFAHNVQAYSSSMLA